MKRSVSVPGQPNLSQNPMGVLLYMRVGHQSQAEAQQRPDSAPRSRTRRLVSVRGIPSSSAATTEPRMLVRYAIYAREPRCIRASIDRARVQEQVCEKHLALHASEFMQCVHAGTYVDVGYDADAPDRHSLQRLLTDVLARKIDVVIIAGEWSSVAMNVTDLANIFTALESTGVPLLSAVGLTDFRSEGGQRLFELTRSLAAIKAQAGGSRSEG
jgi:hypothetical protein